MYIYDCIMKNLFADVDNWCEQVRQQSIIPASIGLIFSISCNQDTLRYLQLLLSLKIK